MYNLSSYQNELPFPLARSGDLKIVFDDTRRPHPGLHNVLVGRHVIRLQDGLAAIEEVLGALHKLEAVALSVHRLHGVRLPEPTDPTSVLRVDLLTKEIFILF